jgi:hypothetical protein
MKYINNNLNMALLQRILTDWSLGKKLDKGKKSAD